MIIFYDKQAGKIVGTIDGRIHGDDHLKMWVGDKDKNGRIVCQWVKHGEDFIPELPIFSELEKTRDMSKFRVDTATGKVVRS